MIVRQGMRPIGIGLLIGIAASFALSNLLSSFLIGISAIDPVTFVAVPLLLAGVALVASIVPAHRASRIDPMRALRYE